MKPSEKALAIQEKVKELGSQKATAKELGISPAKVSTYLRLLTLPKEDIIRIDKGDLPVNYRRRPTRHMSKVVGDHESGLNLIRRVGFTTVGQICQYMRWSEFKARYVLDYLCRRKLIIKNTEFRPYVYSLGPKGFRYFDVNKQQRVVSGLVIHQRLICNAIELEVRSVNSSAEMKSRDYCLSKGLYPKAGEYLMEYKEGSALILIDDQMIDSTSILHCLLRQHYQEQSRFDLIKTYWYKHVDCVIVYSVSQIRRTTHENFIKNIKKAEIKSKTIGDKRAVQMFKIPLSALTLYKAHKGIIDSMRFDSRYIQPFWDIL